MARRQVPGYGTPKTLVVRRHLLAAALVAVMLPSAPTSAAPTSTVYVATFEKPVLTRLTVSGSRVVSRRTLARDRAIDEIVPSDLRGTTLATMTLKGEVTYVDLYDVRTGRRLRRIDPAGRGGNAQFTPDGKHLVVGETGLTGEAVQLVVTDLKGGGRRTLVAATKTANEDDILSGHAISPDGRTVYVARTPFPGVSTLLAVDFTTSEETVIPVVGPGLNVLNVRVSPDGKTLALTAYVAATGTIEVLFVPTAGGAGRRVAPPQGSHYVASSFTPDSKRAWLSVLDDFAENPVSLATVDVETLAVTVTPVENTTGFHYAVPASK